jgi:hypothetical protein
MLAGVEPPNEQPVVRWHPDAYAFTEHGTEDLGLVFGPQMLRAFENRRRHCTVTYWRAHGCTFVEDR